MLILCVRHASRVERATAARLEPDALANPRQPRESGRTERPLRHERARRTRSLEGVRHPSHAPPPTIGAALVEHNHARDGGMIGQHGGIRWRGHDVNRPILCQPRKEGRGQHHVAEEAGLQNGAGGHGTDQFVGCEFGFGVTGPRTHDSKPEPQTQRLISSNR